VWVRGCMGRVGGWAGGDRKRRAARRRVGNAGREQGSGDRQRWREGGEGKEERGGESQLLMGGDREKGGGKKAQLGDRHMAGSYSYHTPATRTTPCAPCRSVSSPAAGRNAIASQALPALAPTAAEAHDKDGMRLEGSGRGRGTGMQQTDKERGSRRKRDDACAHTHQPQPTHTHKHTHTHTHAYMHTNTQTHVPEI
jgi:hypothetical protein